jgi:hypothetical protein
MNRDDAIKLIMASKLPDVLMALVGDESSREIGERLGVKASVVASFAPFFGIDRTQVLKASKQKAFHKNKHINHAHSGNALQCFKNLVRGGVTPSDAVKQVSINYDISVDAAASIVKWAIDDFKNKKIEASRESTRVTEKIRSQYDAFLGEGYNKTQACQKLADLYQYDVYTIKRKLKGFIPANDYQGGRPPKKENPTA